MGRGRQKAKQTKVARRLKYDTRPIDPEQLRRELAGSTGPAGGSEAEDELDGYDDDGLGSEDDEDEPDDGGPGHGEPAGEHTTSR